jgi:hypothetical protein
MPTNLLSKLIQFWTSKTRTNREAAEEIERVLNLPFEEVKHQALRLISDGRWFTVVPNREPSSNAMDERLGPILREFFSRFESIKQENGDFLVSRDAVSDSALRPGFVKIGSDFAHSELVIKQGEDRVYMVTDAEHRLEGLPTIYHNICLLG